METKTLLEYGTVGYYTNCEVIQIILYNKKDKEYWNYFTHIFFSESCTEMSKREWLTEKPKTINSSFQVMISKQIVSVTDIISVIDNAIDSQNWVLGEDCARLDEVFVVDPRFVPETDPTGSIISENTLVPLEKSFYGSNFLGNYYIIELFSTKKNLNLFLSDYDKKKIQKEINAARLQLDLYSLSDRIGNVFCKLPIEIIKHHPTKLSPERGVAGKFELSKMMSRNVNCYLNISAFNDHMIIENKIFSFVLTDNNPQYTYEIEPNRYKNIVTVTDQDTGVIYYSSEHDYTYGSDYYSTITPPNYLIQASSYRTLLIDGIEQKIRTVNLSGIGEVSIEKEIFEIEQRQNSWRDKQINESNFFKAFENGDERVAFDTIKSILNDKTLLWDLKEIWIIDPYLSATDILQTVVYCEKKDIVIKCLTDIGTINRNRETRVEVDEGYDRFEGTKKAYAMCLNNSIPMATDIKMEYRTVYGNHGKQFHDRYLILKYGINKCRVWALGISVNSLGRSHHIIQIVENPSAVADIFDEIWRDTDCVECKIYSNIKEEK